MENSFYLVAMVPLESTENRYLPIGGKSIVSNPDKYDFPKEVAVNISLEIFLRIFQNYDTNPIKNSITNTSIILLKISIEDLQNKLPIIKKRWIDGSTSEVFFKELSEICDGIWRAKFKKYEGVVFEKIE